MELITSKNPLERVLYDKEHKDKLVELGCYQEWKENIKNLSSSKDLRGCDFREFIDDSFLWSRTPQGNSFWSAICRK